MARPKKIKWPFWLWFHRKIMGESVSKLAKRYKVSKRTVWRYLK
jgi:predicted transcriptional regulator|tara:strand:+ start:3708 stop:3839 length:132 start_codon:yes stop_codon:yes gene_type:complete